MRARLARQDPSVVPAVVHSGTGKIVVLDEHPRAYTAEAAMELAGLLIRASLEVVRTQAASRVRLRRLGLKLSVV